MTFIAKPILFVPLRFSPIPMSTRLRKNGSRASENCTWKDLFEGGPIEITVFATGQKRVKMGVQAPTQLTIWRKDAPGI